MHLPHRRMTWWQSSTSVSQRDEYTAGIICPSAWAYKFCQWLTTTARLICNSINDWYENES